MNNVEKLSREFSLLLEALNSGEVSAEAMAKGEVTFEDISKHLSEEVQQDVEEENRRKAAELALNESRDSLVSVARDSLNQSIIALMGAITEEAGSLEGLIRNEDDPKGDDVSRLLDRIQKGISPVMNLLQDNTNSDGVVVQSGVQKIFGKSSRSNGGGSGTRAGSVSLYLNQELIDFPTFYEEVLGEPIGADKGLRGVLNRCNSKEHDVFGKHSGSDKYIESLKPVEMGYDELREVSGLISDHFGVDFYFKRVER